MLKLRYIILATILLGVILGVGIINLVSRYTILEYFRELEDNKISEDITRIQSVIMNEVDNLDRTNTDWAHWDDSYRFIEDQNTEFVKSNLSTDTLVGIRLSFILFYDLDGKLLSEAWVDLEEKTETQPPAWLTDWVIQNNFLIHDPQNLQNHSGLISTPDGPAFVSIQAIRNTGADLSARGTLIMGRFLTTGETQRISSLIKIPFELISLHEAGTSSQYAAIMNELSKKGTTVFQYYNENIQNSYSDRVKAFHYLQGIYGQPAMLIEVEQPRRMYEKGLEGIYAFSIIIIVLGVAMGIGLSLLLHYMFTRRLERINDAVQTITKTKNLAIRVPVTQSDEITQLGLAINSMVDSLDQAQKTAIRLERRFRNVLENMQMIAIMLNREGQITFCNQYFLDLSGFTEDEVLGKNWIDQFITDAYREEIQEMFSSYWLDERKSAFNEFSILDRTNNNHLITLSCTPMLDDQGTVVGVACVGQDITVQRKAEEALKESEKTLRSILDAVPGGIGLVKNGVIVWISDHIEEFTGYTADELIGQPPSIFYKDGKIARNILENIRDQIDYHSFAYVRTKWCTKTGNSTEIDLRAAPLHPYDWRAGTIVVALDVTEQLQAEKRLRESFDQAKNLLSRMSALRNIDELITSPQESKDSMYQILRLIRETLSLDVVLVSLYEPENEIVSLKAVDGLQSKDKFPSRISTDFPFIKEAISTATPVFKNHLNEEEKEVLANRFSCSNDFDHYMVIPLVVKGSVLGILEALANNHTGHTDDLQDSLQTMSLQLAVFMDNASLFQQREKAYQELQATYEATMQGWALALEMRDKETNGHSTRVVQWTVRLAQKMGYPQEKIIHLRRGVLLHDIGKMSIPDSILLKEDSLTEEEWEIMKQHPQYAYDLLKDIEHLKPALMIPYYHHERWNGSGYPEGLKEKAIPLEARIFAVVDIYDALIHTRPYKPAWETSKVIAYLKQQSGILLDPDVVTAFLEMLVEDGEISEDVLFAADSISAIGD